MVRLKVKYQLNGENEQSKEFRYEKLVSNNEFREILDEIDNEYNFEDCVEDGMNCLIRIQEEIRQLILRATDFNKLFKQYGINDPFEAFELKIDFDPELYMNDWEYDNGGDGS